MSDNLGHLTEEEQATLLAARQKGQQCLTRIGELVFQTHRFHQQERALEQQIHLLREKETAALTEQATLCNELNEIDQQGRIVIEQVAKRLGLDPAIQWIALQDGTIKRVDNAAT